MPKVVAPIVSPLSALIPGLGPGNKSAAGPPAPIDTSKQEAAAEAKAAESEKRRRQLIAQQNQLVKTTPLGAAVSQNKLGGISLTGA